MFVLFTIGGLAFVSFPMIKNAKENLVEESARHQAKKSGVVESTDGLKTKSEPLTIVDDTPYKDNEAGFMQRIHDMTHQKVYANDKWGALEASEENITMLLSLLDENDYDDEDYYRKVLNIWKKGDFSNAVEVHNKIWRAQDGSIGKAKRLLTPKEEQLFVENNF